MWTQLCSRQRSRQKLPTTIVSQPVRSAALALGVMLLTSSGLACSVPTDQTLLNPAGPPEVIGVFVTQNNVFTLAYRKEHPNVAQGQVYLPDWADANGVTGPEAVIEARSANPFGNQRIRVIVDELLRGRTMEQFVCACSTSCDNGIVASLEPIDCGDNPDTAVNETGRFLDVDFDGVPDDTLLLPGIFTVDCGGGARTWTNDLDDGWYNPSGNQFPSADGTVFIWDSVGPAIVLEPPALPTGQVCTIAVADSVTDKDDISIPAGDFPADIFQVDVLRLTSSSPRNNQSGIAPSLLVATATFNSSLDLASVVAPGAITLTPQPAGTPEVINAGLGGPDTIEVHGRMICPTYGCMTTDVDGNCTVCNAPPVQDPPLQDELPSGGPHSLLADTVYILSITTAVTDTFGVPLPAQIDIQFRTSP